MDFLSDPKTGTIVAIIGVFVATLGLLVAGIQVYFAIRKSSSRTIPGPPPPTVTPTPFQWQPIYPPPSSIPSRPLYNQVQLPAYPMANNTIPAAYPVYKPANQGSSTFATTSLTLGINAFVMALLALPSLMCTVPVSLIVAILGIVFGSMALKAQAYRERALWGLWLSIASLVVVSLSIIVLIIFASVSPPSATPLSTPS